MWPRPCRGKQGPIAAVLGGAGRRALRTSVRRVSRWVSEHGYAWVCTLSRVLDPRWSHAASMHVHVCMHVYVP